MGAFSEFICVNCLQQFVSSTFYCLRYFLWLSIFSCVRFPRGWSPVICNLFVSSAVLWVLFVADTRRRERERESKSEIRSGRVWWIVKTNSIFLRSCSVVYTILLWRRGRRKNSRFLSDADPRDRSSRAVMREPAAKLNLQEYFSNS